MPNAIARLDSLFHLDSHLDTDALPHLPPQTGWHHRSLPCRRRRRRLSPKPRIRWWRGTRRPGPRWSRRSSTPSSTWRWTSSRRASARTRSHASGQTSRHGSAVARTFCGELDVRKDGADGGVWTRLNQPRLQRVRRSVGTKQSFYENHYNQRWNNFMDISFKTWEEVRPCWIDPIRFNRRPKGRSSTAPSLSVIHCTNNHDTLTLRSFTHVFDVYR